MRVSWAGPGVSPIRPSERARYPKDWAAISLDARMRANWRCECRGECGTDHMAEWTAACKVMTAEADPARCDAWDTFPHPTTGAYVVLTVAHLNHQPEDCRPENLRAMCQRCHNRMDMPHRAAGTKARRREQCAVADLFGEGDSNG